jgi:dynein light chain roadblock-type
MVAKITLTPEIDESLKRIQDAKNVDGILLINREGIPIKTSLDSSVTAQVKQMALTCRIIFRRLRTTS